MTPYDVAKIGVLRMTPTLSSLRHKDNIRVNCLVPHWIAVPEVKAYWETLTPEDRRAKGVPAKLIELDEVARAVVRLTYHTRQPGWPRPDSLGWSPCGAHLSH
jgi:NAD(P)-dependent dehydrogenase (short-subunit alcohol dehydrogenase family)